MKNKLLFVIPAFSTGGITSSLASLIGFIKSDYHIEILCRNNPENIDIWHGVKVLKENIWLSLFLYNSSRLSIAFSTILRVIRIAFRLVHIDLYPLFCSLGGKMINSTKYDAIISFHEHLNSFVCYIPAKKHIAWTHSIYSRYVSMIGNVDESSFLNKYDSIVLVSEFAKKDFLSVRPEFANKVRVVYNIIDIDSIRRKALVSPFDSISLFDNQSFKIISIGRLDLVKQFHKIPLIAHNIRKRTDRPFKWFVLGDGDKGIYDDIQNQIHEYKLEDYVFLLGNKSNVFPYLRNSDILVHTSLSETCSLVVNEALALGIPVIVNNYGCAEEFVADGKFGYIIPNDNMSIKISELINNEAELLHLRNELNAFHTHNLDAIQSFKQLVIE